MKRAKPKTKTCRVHLRLYDCQRKKLEQIAKRAWPSLDPRKYRGAALVMLLNYADPRDYR